MASGPREARFNALYEATRPRLLAYAIRRTTSLDDAGDVVAETFGIAWRRLDDVPQGEASLLWLFATARRVNANRVRGSQRREDLVRRLATHLATALQSDSGSLGTDAIDARRALARLGDNDRELLMLVAWEGLVSAQLGYVLGCSPTAVRIRLHHARPRLKAELGEFSLTTKQPGSPRQSPRGGFAPTDAPEEV